MCFDGATSSYWRAMCNVRTRRGIFSLAYYLRATRQWSFAWLLSLHLSRSLENGFCTLHNPWLSDDQRVSTVFEHSTQFRPCVQYFNILLSIPHLRTRRERKEIWAMFNRYIYSCGTMPENPYAMRWSSIVAAGNFFVRKVPYECAMDRWTRSEYAALHITINQHRSGIRLIRTKNAKMLFASSFRHRHVCVLCKLNIGITDQQANWHRMCIDICPQRI